MFIVEYFKSLPEVVQIFTIYILGYILYNYCMYMSLKTNYPESARKFLTPLGPLMYFINSHRLEGYTKLELQGKPLLVKFCSLPYVIVVPVLLLGILVSWPYFFGYIVFRGVYLFVTEIKLDKEQKNLLIKWTMRIIFLFLAYIVVIFIATAAALVLGICFFGMFIFCKAVDF